MLRRILFIGVATAVVWSGGQAAAELDRFARVIKPDAIVDRTDLPAFYDFREKESMDRTAYRS